MSLSPSKLALLLAVGAATAGVAGVVSTQGHADAPAASAAAPPPPEVDVAPVVARKITD